MKIKYISPITIPSRSADSIQVVKACDSLVSEGCEVSLSIPYREKQDKSVTDVHGFYDCKNVFPIVWERIKFIPESYTILLIALRAVCSGYDVVFSRSIPAAFICALLGKKVFIEIHEPLDRFKLLKIISSVLVKMPNLKGIVTNCTALEVHTEKNFSSVAGRIITIQNGAEKHSAVEKKALLPEGKMHVGYAGQLYKGKGVEVIAELSPKFPDVFFHVLGGLPEDIKYWKLKLSAQKNVIFHGFVDPNKLPTYIKAFDVVLAPYQRVVHGYNAKNNLAHWTSPMKVFDYMAAAKPIICSDLPFMHEVLESEKEALFCPPDDVESWAKALSKLIEDKEFAKSLGEAALGKLSDQFTWEKRAQKIKQFLEKAMCKT